MINFYIIKATGVRTEDEHPLNKHDLKLFKYHFKNVTIHHTWFFTLWIFVKFYLLDRIDPNKERYWKKIILEHKQIEKVYRPLYILDRVFLSLFPFLRKYCWNIVILCTK